MARIWGYSRDGIANVKEVKGAIDSAGRDSRVILEAQAISAGESIPI